MQCDTEADLRLSQVFAADLDNIDRFCRLMSDQFLDVIPGQSMFTVELLVREMLNNAVLHGSRLDSDMQVACWMSLRGDLLTIRVTDSGEGFDWQAVRTRAVPPTATSGRGLAILHQYADDVQFNPRGNEVTLVKRVR